MDCGKGSNYDRSGYYPGILLAYDFVIYFYEIRATIMRIYLSV